MVVEGAMAVRLSGATEGSDVMKRAADVEVEGSPVWAVFVFFGLAVVCGGVGVWLIYSQVGQAPACLPPASC